MPESKPSQPVISSYFQSTPSPKKTGKRNAPIDLTSDGEQDVSKPLTKRPKVDRHGPLVDIEPTSESSKASVWRYSPNKPQQGGISIPRSAAAQKRHVAFKRVLAQDENPLLRQKLEFIEDTEGHSDEDEDDDVDANADTEKILEDESDGSIFFQNLSKLQNKGKNAPRTTALSKPCKKAPVLGPSGKPYTKLESQVLQLKQENPGTLLMVEVGYKYRFFGDDAKVAAKVLGVVAYTSRNFLTASVSDTWHHVHLKNLISAGYRVGIVRQIETAALKKASANKNTLFERKIVSLYTATTYVGELGSVDDEKNNAPRFMCLVEEKKGSNTVDVSLGLIIICPSTGDVVWDDFEDTGMRLELEVSVVNISEGVKILIALQARFAHTKPAELLAPKKEDMTSATNKIIYHFAQPSESGSSMRVESIDDILSFTDAYAKVAEFYGDKRHEGASENFKSGKLLAEITDFPRRVVIALAHAVQYLSQFGIANALRETKFFTRFATSTHMLLAANTMKNLEIYRNEDDGTARGSLIWILDRTKTRFGSRLLRHWVGRPLVEQRVLQERIDAVTEIVESSSDRLLTLRGLLKDLPDLPKGLCRIQYGQCTPKELATLLPAFAKISNAYEDIQGPETVGLHSHILNDIIASLPKLKEPIKDILNQVHLSMLKEGKKELLWTDCEKFPELSDAHMSLQVVLTELKDELKPIRKQLRRPALQWTTVGLDDYLVEVRIKDKVDIPDDWILHSRTKVFARYYAPSVREKLEELAQRKETLEIETNRAFQSFLKDITEKYYTILRDAVNQLAIADCLLSLALVAMRDGYVKPEFTQHNTLEIVDGRHPMMEAYSENPYCGNTLNMGGQHPINKIITGPNMGGKSSCVRMVALLVIMAQIGSYVPANAMKLGMVDSILTRMGASDDIARGRSTFMVELSETSEILHTATERSLVILDELGRGTATHDGMAIAAATLEHLALKVQCKTLFITHYPMLAAKLESKFPTKIHNLHMGYKTETRLSGIREITFLYRLVPGLATESFGIECGRMAKLPEKLLAVAAEKSELMKADIDERTLRARLCGAPRLIQECFSSTGIRKDILLEELQTTIEILRKYRKGI